MTGEGASDASPLSVELRERVVAAVTERSKVGRSSRGVGDDQRQCGAEDEHDAAGCLAGHETSQQPRV